jgi:LPS export ABC transporter permease LptG
MRTLRHYLWREIAQATLFVLFALLALFMFFDLVQQLDEVGRRGFRLQHAFSFVALSLPARTYELMPIAALIGTIYVLAKLAANSEFTIMRVSGMSTRRLMQSLMGIGLVIVALTYLLGEFISPPAEQLAQRVRLVATGSGITARDFRSGVWVRDVLRDDTGAIDAFRFINVRQVSADRGTSGWRIFEFDRDYRLRSMTTAVEGHYVAGEGWTLTDVVETRLPQLPTQAAEPVAAGTEVVREASSAVAFRPAARHFRRVDGAARADGGLGSGTVHRPSGGNAAADRTLRDCALEQDLLSVGGVGDDGAGDAVCIPACEGRRPEPEDLHRRDDRCRLLRSEQALRAPWATQHLAADHRRGITQPGRAGAGDEHVVLDRAALARHCRASGSFLSAPRMFIAASANCSTISAWALACQPQNDPQHVADKEAPETERASPFGCRRDQPGRHDSQHHRRPLHQIEIVHGILSPREKAGVAGRPSKQCAGTCKGAAPSPDQRRIICGYERVALAFFSQVSDAGEGQVGTRHPMTVAGGFGKHAASLLRGSLRIAIEGDGYRGVGELHRGLVYEVTPQDEPVPLALDHEHTVPGRVAAADHRPDSRHEFGIPSYGL